MRRIQESVGYTGKYRSKNKGADDQDSGVSTWVQFAIFLIIVGLVGPVIPQLRPLMWSVGGGVCLVLFITSIIMMFKGAPLRGVAGLLFSLIVLPVWIVVVPIAVLMTSESRGWKEVLLEEAQRQEAAVRAASSPGRTEAPEGVSATPVAPVGDSIETITSKDGRTIRGTIEAYDAGGVRMKREDGFVVNVAFDLMSAEDMQKYRDRYQSSAR